jgi:hypothetical protein
MQSEWSLDHEIQRCRFSKIGHVPQVQTLAQADSGIEAIVAWTNLARQLTKFERRGGREARRGVMAEAIWLARRGREVH